MAKSVLTSKLKCFFLILFFISGNTFVQAQITRHEQISTRQGLSQGLVYDALQDNDGFIWFATKDGLNRYDGYNFKVFTHDVFNPTSISGNDCTALLKDKRGRIWIGTNLDGLNLFNPKTQKFYHAKIQDKNQVRLGNYSIENLIEDKTGTIWIMIDNYPILFKVDVKEDFPANIDFTSEVKQVPATALPAPSQWRLNKRSLMYDASAACFGKQHWINNSKLQFGPNTPILPDTNNGTWTTNYYGVIYKSEKLYKEIKGVPGESIELLCYLNDSSLVVGTYNYIWILPSNPLLCPDSLSVKNAIVKLPSTTQLTRFVFQDANNNIWVLTAGYGLKKYSAKLNVFKSYLPAKSLNTIFENHNGEIFVRGIYTPRLAFYLFDKAKDSMIGIKEFEQSKPDIEFGMTQDKQENYWLLSSSHKNGLHIDRNGAFLSTYNNRFQFIKIYALKSTQVDNYNACQMLVDKNNDLFISTTSGGLIKFDIDKEAFTYYNYNSILPKAQGIDMTSHLYFDAKNNLWICTKQGLVKMENYNGAYKFKLYSNDPSNRNSLSGNFTTCCIDDAYDNNLLWISTKGGGVNLMNKNTGNFRHFTTKDGLPNNVTYGLVQSADSSLWISTNKGLSMLNTKTYNFSNYYSEDGLQNDEFNTASFGKDSKGQLYFGGVNGLTIFNPEKLKKIKQSSIIKIIALKVNNQEINVLQKDGILSSCIEYLPKINLKYNQNQISIESSLLDYTTPENNRYKYQLIGIDQDWVDAGNNRTASYAQLPSGHYVFKIMGSSNGEIWSDPIALDITINPPFYRTLWAYLIYVGLVAYSLFWWFRNQIKSVRLQEQVVYREKEAAQLAALNQLKTNFFSNISHEIRTPLTLILGPSDALAQKDPKNELYQLIFRNAKRLLELINQILDISKLDAGQMPVHYQNKELVTYFYEQVNNFKNIAEGKNIVLSLAQNKTNIEGKIDDDKVNKIMYNVLSNAIKFTPENGTVKVDVQYQNNNAEITIIDSGIGIAADKISSVFDRYYQTSYSTKKKQEGTGIGLALVKELVELLKGSISIKSEEGKGTKVQILMPLPANE
jgi:signal transduction histidine kinase/ligand-binding sensor domain-containing protein